MTSIVVPRAVPKYIFSDAVFSEDRLRRYYLWRQWDSGPTLMWCGLNPSSAGSKSDDPTIRRIVRFSKDFGYGGCGVVNASSEISTDPRNLSWGYVGEDIQIIREYADGSDVVACWGSTYGHCVQIEYVKTQLVKVAKSVFCLGTTKDGHPKHPLYLSASTKLQEYRV